MTDDLRPSITETVGILRRQDRKTTNKWVQRAFVLADEVERLSAELTRLKAAQPEHDRTVRLAALEEAAQFAMHWYDNSSLITGRWTPMQKSLAAGIRALIDQTGVAGDCSHR